jgi:DHA1 family solute carrier family 18 vesicular amine transporter 1/2
MTDLAAVAQGMDGIGFAHVYAMFNIAYGLGNAFGPLIGGQVYEHARHGWVAVCIINLGLCAAASLPAFYFAGPSPLIGRAFWTRTASRNAEGAEASVALGKGVSGSA